MPHQNKVKVSFYANLRQVVGRKSVDCFFAEPVSVRELCRGIIREFPGLEAELRGDQGELHAHINILVDGRDIRYLDGNFNTLLEDGAQVSIFPALGGGWKV